MLPPMKSLLRLLPVVGFLGLLVSCQSMKPRHHYDSPAHRPTNPSAVRVKVSLSNQAIYVMEGQRPLLVTACTVGGSGNGRTPTGNFTIFNKPQEGEEQVLKRWNCHRTLQNMFLAFYPAWRRPIQPYTTLPSRSAQ